MQDLQRHKYVEAAARLKALLAEFPAERALLDRVRVYLDVCEREVRRRPSAPKTVEERLTLATAALNNGEDRTAEKLANEVLSSTPDHDLALYLLAAVAARRGDADAAIDRLRRAMSISPDVRAQARHDADFEILREMAAFQELLDGPPTAPAAPRSTGRGRSGR